MDVEPTTLSDVIRLISEVLHQHYGVDPEPLLAAAGIDPHRSEVSGSRVSREAVMLLWELAAAATNDPSVGLVIGSKVRPTTFYALGVAFLTSETLADALEVLVRYYRVIVTVPLELTLKNSKQTTVLEITYTDPEYPLLPVPYDSFIASIVGLCRLATTPDFHPLEIRLQSADNNRGGDYKALFEAPVVFDAATNALVFDRKVLAEPLPGRSVDLLLASDKVLDTYLDALSPEELSTKVRKLILQLLPTGKAGQDTIASRLNMSRSTLQRRLQHEHTNYKELLENTRRTLAVDYVHDRRHSLSYIAFLLGFSDQSNFSRAFRRWTGKSPKVYRDEMSDRLASE